jgi:succinate dehydrogenase / fumarate reductase, cytochrome b subunit
MFSSSVGRKVLMALTGLVWYGFLVGHLVGNLQLLAGDGGTAFDKYADFLESLPQLVVPSELILLLALALHVYCAVSLSREAAAARPIGYRQLRTVGGRSVASRFMIWSGLIIVVFLALHIFTFKYGERVDGSLFRLVEETFRQPVWAGCYLFVMAVLGAHLWHALRSAFQTLGLSGRPTWRRLSIALCVIIAGGFALIPVAMFVGG